MKIGTKSLLFGVHQFLWHPITVYLAWRKLYGPPNWKEILCIIVHDWGYWGCSNMDGPEGELHPIKGAHLIERWLHGSRDKRPCQTCREGNSTSCFQGKYSRLVLFHSGHLAVKLKNQPSQLCWPDKLSITYEPAWWYLFRARLSGEIKEFKRNGEIYTGRSMTEREWFDWAKAYMINKANTRQIPKTRIAVNY